jgi:hypothetical protein
MGRRDRHKRELPNMGGALLLVHWLGRRLLAHAVDSPGRITETGSIGVRSVGKPGSCSH